MVSQVGAHAAQTFGRDLVPLELTPQHVGILRLLATSDEPLTQRDLAERLRVLPSRLVALLDALASNFWSLMPLAASTPPPNWSLVKLLETNCPVAVTTVFSLDTTSTAMPMFTREGSS